VNIYNSTLNKIIEYIERKQIWHLCRPITKRIMNKSPNCIDICYTENSMKSCFQRLKERGYLPENVVDIGAYNGEWTLMLKSVFPNANVFMVEAQKSKKDVLRKVCLKYSGTVQFRTALLGKKEGETVFYISAIDDTSGSTLFPERTNVHQNPVKMKITPLDSLLPNDFICDFLKLDVQGAELDVLSGATGTLKNTKVILMEVSILQYNIGAPLIAEVFQYMQNISFVCLDIAEIHRHKASGMFPIQVDLLFMREDSFLMPEMFHYDI
jgi:FkbM family methyltransferase